jgi:hypothetical protein
MFRTCKPCLINNLDGVDHEAAWNAVCLINGGVYKDIKDFQQDYSLEGDAETAVKRCQLAKFCGKQCISEGEKAYGSAASC